jgi:hypothetical protein
MGMIFLSENACKPLIQALETEGHEIYRVCASDVVYPAIASHADIYMCRVKDTLLIDDSIITEPSLKEEYMEIIESQAENPIIPAFSTDDGVGHIVFEMGGIGYDYPDDVPYNAVATERFFIHNTELTSPALLDRARFAGLQIINVNQGYTRCSCLPVGNRAVITADEGIARTLRAVNAMILEEDPDSDDTIDILLIRKGYIHLEGFEYGFIGGTAGTVDNCIYFNGDLTEHPDSDLIINFIENRGFKPVWFPDEPLTDIGSIFCI